MTTSFIYGLVDPRTVEVRYIGKTKNGLKRTRQHATPSLLRKDFTHKANWIRELCTLGLSYQVRILEEVSIEQLCEKEIWWIAYGRAQGWPLTNLTDGGEGVHGLQRTAAHCAAISKANKGRRLTEEQYLRLLATMKTRKPRRSGVPIRKGWHHSAETKQKIAAGQKNRKPLSAESLEALRLSASQPIVDVHTGRRFPSVKRAAEELGLCARSISRVLTRKFKQTGGHSFRYAED